MKYDIYNVDYDGKVHQGGAWWAWKERCDRCGHQTRTHSVLSSKKPDVEEADFCSDCIHYFIGAKIPYDVASKKHINWLEKQIVAQ